MVGDDYHGTHKHAEAAWGKAKTGSEHGWTAAPREDLASGPDKALTFATRGWLEFTGRARAMEQEGIGRWVG